MTDEQWLEELLKATEEDKMTEKQSRVIVAAIEVFAEKGYSGASTSEIAQRAGVAEGTIFRHYKTKKELLVSIVGSFTAKLVAPFLLKDFINVIESPYPSFDAFIRAVITNRMEFVRKNKKLLRILLQEIPFHPELSESFKKLVGQLVFQKMRAVVERFQKEGQIRSDLPPATAIRLAVSTAIGFVLARFMLFPEHAWEEENELEWTIQYIVRGLSPDSTPGTKG